jgi:hypothetical protein
MLLAAVVCDRLLLHQGVVMEVVVDGALRSIIARVSFTRAFGYHRLKIGYEPQSRVVSLWGNTPLLSFTASSSLIILNRSSDLSPRLLLQQL